jgi:tetrahydromethanopterin S-methyltransferase subunit G
MLLKEDDFRAIGDIIRIKLEPMQDDINLLKAVVATKVNIEEIRADMITQDDISEISEGLNCLEKKVDDGFAEVDARLTKLEKKVDDGFRNSDENFKLIVDKFTEIATIIDKRCDRLEMMLLNHRDVTAQNTIDIEQLRRKA